MFTLPNAISLCRIPLAFAFLQTSPMIRALAIILALFTDWLDGYVARKYKCKTQLGVLLDPLADRFFVLFALIIVIGEHEVAVWKILAMLSRDIAIVIFASYLFMNNRHSYIKFKAIWCGKVSTVLQLLVLLALTVRFPVPNEVFLVFLFLGALSLVELSYKNYLQPTT